MTNRYRLTVGADIRAWTKTIFEAENHEDALNQARLRAKEIIEQPAHLDWSHGDFDIAGDETFMLDTVDDTDTIIDEIHYGDAGDRFQNRTVLQDFVREVSNSRVTGSTTIFNTAKELMAS